MSNYKNGEMIRVAYYYYKLGMTQSEIATKMNMSRQRVNRILKRALEEDVVQINIVDMDKYNIDLEDQLEKKFGLTQSVVVTPLDEASTISSLGVAGVEFLEGALNKGSILGVTWGKTVSEVAKKMPYNQDMEVSVVQLIGGLNIAYTEMQADEITRTIAKKLGGTAHILYAPAIVEYKETKEAFMADMNLIDIFSHMKKCNIMLVGIGELKEDTKLFKDDDFNKKFIQHLIRRGSVGDIGFRWFDKDGNVVENAYDDRTIGYDILKNKNDTKVVGISGGERKYEAILGALRGGYLDVLITDSNTAKKLIES